MQRTDSRRGRHLRTGFSRSSLVGAPYGARGVGVGDQRMCKSQTRHMGLESPLTPLASPLAVLKAVRPGSPRRVGCGNGCVPRSPLAV